MNIQEATKLALEKDLFITRNSTGNWKVIRIKPTNTADCCIVFFTEAHEEQVGRKIAPGKRWQPKAEDLVADDWIVTTLNS